MSTYFRDVDCSEYIRKMQVICSKKWFVHETSVARHLGFTDLDVEAGMSYPNRNQLTGFLKDLKFGRVLDGELKVGRVDLANKENSLNVYYTQYGRHETFLTMAEDKGNTVISEKKYIPRWFCSSSEDCVSLCFFLNLF